MTKKPGRVKLVCVKPECGKAFSTHSSNREFCHTCKPRCTERHTFVKKVKNEDKPNI